MSGIVKDGENPLLAQFYNSQTCNITNIPGLQFTYEEADMSIIPHIKWEIESFPGRNVFLVVSQDTNIVVLLLFYVKSFKVLGLTELYMHLCKGDNKRRFPIHLLQSRPGDDYCKSIFKMSFGYWV